MYEQIYLFQRYKKMMEEKQQEQARRMQQLIAERDGFVEFLKTFYVFHIIHESIIINIK